VAPNVPGFLKAAAPRLFGGIGPFWSHVYDLAWFVGVGVAALVYGALMLGARRPAPVQVPG
jgi:nucleobase:cation symporter-1, NCS1 family